MRVIALKYIKGFSVVLDGDFDYNRLDFSFEYRKKHKIETSNIFISGSRIDSSLPFGSLYTRWGNSSSDFYAPNLLQAVGLYEFVSNRVVSLMFDHNFRNVIVNSKFMKPELKIYHNAGIGDLNNSVSHGEIEFKSMNKDYTEAGIGLNNLFRFN